MKTDIWMPLFIGDYTSDTIGLTHAQHGAYLLALMAYWKKGGPLTESEARGIMGEQAESLSRFFRIDQHGWHSKRADKELGISHSNLERNKARTAAATKARMERNVDVTNNVTFTPSPSPSPSPLSSSASSSASSPSPSITPKPPNGVAESVYSEYPLKVGKPAALRAIQKQLAQFPADKLITACREYSRRLNGSREFVPHPSTWFNQQRFNDDPETWIRSHSAPTTRGGTPPGMRMNGTTGKLEPIQPVSARLL